MADRIDHAAEAERIRKLAYEYELANGKRPSTAEAMVALGAVANGYANAQVHATLAMVEQKRITNLIAYLTVLGEVPGPDDNRQIREALGL